MVILCSKRLICGIHFVVYITRFRHVRLCTNLMTARGPNLMNEKGTKELEQLKCLNLKIPEGTSKHSCKH